MFSYYTISYYFCSTKPLVVISRLGFLSAKGGLVIIGGFLYGGLYVVNYSEIVTNAV